MAAVAYCRGIELPDNRVGSKTKLEMGTLYYTLSLRILA
jgi:hypothetical protein